MTQKHANILTALCWISLFIIGVSGLYGCYKTSNRIQALENTCKRHLSSSTKKARAINSLNQIIGDQIEYREMLIRKLKHQECVNPLLEKVAANEGSM